MVNLESCSDHDFDRRKPSIERNGVQMKYSRKIKMAKCRCNLLPSRHTVTEDGNPCEVKKLANPRSADMRTRDLLATTQYSIDIIAAILLLTGQITTTGIFLVPEGFYLGATGPILGGVRSTGQSGSAGVILDVVDVLSAVLLIMNAIRVTGPYITSHRFFLVFSGPLFGIKDIVNVLEPEKGHASGSMGLRNYIRNTMVSRMPKSL